ncbi:hypothetical protein V2J09_019044 [Rumex salicifolius]
MGSGLGKIGVCFTGVVVVGEPPYNHRRRRRNKEVNIVLTDQYDEGLGHSFCYVRPDPAHTNCSKLQSEESAGVAASTAVFRSISGASVSANTSTPLSTTFFDSTNNSTSVSSAFESSNSFASVPLQPIPRNPGLSGPISGPIFERGFMSGPIERGFMSGPLDLSGSLFSGPLDKGFSGSASFRRSLSQSGWAGVGPRSMRRSIIRGLRRAIGKKLSRGQGSIVAPMKGVSTIKYQDSWIVGGCERNNENLTVSSINLSSDGSLDDGESFEGQNLQWAQGKAGEDRVHVVVSEEHGWVFVGIYDGFNGPDATDFLLSNLYSFVHKELKGLLWDEKSESHSFTSSSWSNNSSDYSNWSTETDNSFRGPQSFEQENYPSVSSESNFISNSRRKGSRSSKNSKYKGAARRWKYEFDRERIELDRRLKEQLNRNGLDSSSINHLEVLKALSQALMKTEEAYFDIADKMLVENPELSLMGSCVLVMLMKGEDVYVLNVGDSRAVLGHKAEPDLRLGKIDQDLERINEESLYDVEVCDGVRPTLSAFQLSFDHSTSADEEIQRIRREHLDDSCAIVNDRVKGSLKVTRAFGAGFLKQPKWNNALLEMFRIDYVGASPYINCFPHLYHHRLGPKDRFLILSSDGLYQYFTNEEAVAEVELFITLYPDGDPAQHLVEEVLFRAAKKAGMDFYELLEIPQGERRRYHDDVSLIVISFEGMIWRSCV